METSFVPVLFGADINVYSMARAFHEAYGIKTVAYGMYPSGPCFGSDIIDYRVRENNDDPAVVLKNVEEAAREFAGKTLLVLGCGDNYLTSIAANLDRYPANVIAPYVPLGQMEELIHKEKFYALCDQYGIDHPATFVYHKGMGHDFTLPFDGPFVVKPAESATYWDHPFDTQKKAYVLQTREEVDRVIDEIYDHGYEDSLILQDFIPGDDTNMRVLTCYSDGAGKVKLMCLGHVLLEEHTRHGIGNHAVIITEHDQNLCDKIRAMLEDQGYVGFSNFDIKYDVRDGKYKAFEINCRQGRSNYYVTGAGCNLARLLVEDLILGHALPFHMSDQPSLWRMVPLWVAFRYTPKKYHQEMRALIRAGKDHHSLVYQGDSSLKRRLRVWKNHLGNIKRFHKYVPVPQKED